MQVIDLGGTSFTFTRAEEGLDTRIIHQSRADNHDAAEIAIVQQKLSIQRDLSKDVSERIRATREEAENARKGRTLQKLVDAPAAAAGVAPAACANTCMYVDLCMPDSTVVLLFPSYLKLVLVQIFLLHSLRMRQHMRQKDHLQHLTKGIIVR